MNRNQAKSLLYMGSEFADKYVNRVSVDFMYQARVRDIQRNYLRANPNPASSLDDEVLRAQIARLAEARYALLREQSDLYQVGSGIGAGAPGDPLDDFDAKRDTFIKKTREPVYAPGEMRFIARTGLGNLWICSRRFLLCPLAAIITFVALVAWSGRAATIVGATLLAAMLFCYLFIYIPYATKQVYVRDGVFSTLRDPGMIRSDSGFNIAVFTEDDSTDKAIFRKKKLKDMARWHTRALTLPSLWVGIVMGATCAFLSIVAVIMPITSSAEIFRAAAALALAVVGALVARVKGSNHLLTDRMDSLRKSLRRVKAR